MNGWSEKVKDFLLKGGRIKLIVGLGFVGMALILLSEILPSSDSHEKAAPVAVCEADYEEKLRDGLLNILSSINGVGKAEVMLTISAEEEYIYAEEVRKSETESETSYVLIQENGGKTALVKTVIKPPIKGVVVVCEGGGSSTVRESVYNAVSVALDIPTNRIYVTK